MVDVANSAEGCLDGWEGTTDIGTPFGDGVYRKKSVSYFFHVTVTVGRLIQNQYQKQYHIDLNDVYIFTKYRILTSVLIRSIHFFLSMDMIDRKDLGPQPPSAPTVFRSSLTGIVLDVFCVRNVTATCSHAMCQAGKYMSVVLCFVGVSVMGCVFFRIFTSRNIYFKSIAVLSTYVCHYS